jgi:colanic acid/amylovoran biosynthesis glycosyltransferase
MNNFTIAHSIQPYLFQTGNWIYNQLINSNTIRHIVLTARKENTDQFPFDPVYSLSDMPLIRQFSEKGYRKIFKKWYPYFLNMCKREKVNILHSHFGQYGVLNIPLANKLQTPHVVSFYGADMSKALYYNPKLKHEYIKLFDNVLAIFVEGEYAKKTINKLGCAEEKIFVSHLGVDLKSIRSVKRKWKENEFFKILIVGTFTKKKGIIISLKAINQFAYNNPNIKLEVNLVGDAQQTQESQDTKKEILEFIETSNLKSAVKLHGYIPYKTILEMSYDHHLFMQTSIFGDDGDSEGGFPVIITDMMATGMPVIGSDHCDIPEIIKHEKNGLTANQGDIESTTRAIERTLSNYNNYSTEWIEYNINFLNANFDAKICAFAREKLYERIVKQ